MPIVATTKMSSKGAGCNPRGYSEADQVKGWISICCRGEG